MAAKSTDPDQPTVEYDSIDLRPYGDRHAIWYLFDRGSGQIGVGSPFCNFVAWAIPSVCRSASGEIRTNTRREREICTTFYARREAPPPHLGQA